MFQNQNSSVLNAAPTRLDAVQDPRSQPTRLDRSDSGISPATRLDIPQSQAVPSSLIQLPSALRERFRIRFQLPTAGAEADLFLLEPLDGDYATSEEQLRVLKLYRFNVKPKEDVLEKVRNCDPEHVIRLYEFRQSDGHWFELMEYASEGSLRKLLKNRPWPDAHLQDLLKELWPGLKHLHGLGLIHRDLKPENILIRELMPLDLVITDFGISSLTELSQRFTTASRTVRYAAPEAISGVITQATDYWSLGMILAEACQGRHPFADLSDERAVTQWLTTRPIDLKGIKDTRWQTLCRGLLIRDPDHRWGSDEISRWLSNDSTLSVPVEVEVATGSQVTSIAGSKQETKRNKSPYQIGDTQCLTANELGIALARHWDLGSKDLARGTLRRWCKKELTSVQLERLLFDLDESKEHLDNKLLKLILQLCPDIPPNYRGLSLASAEDFAHLLEQARQASESGEAVKARAIVQAIVKDKLLDKFQSQGKDSVQEVIKRRLQEYQAWTASGGPDVFQPELTPKWFTQIPLDDTIFKTHADNLEYRVLILALAPANAQKVTDGALKFSSSTAWRFWLHDCLDLAQKRGQMFDALMLQPLLLAAQAWYKEAQANVWTGELAIPPLAQGWSHMLETRFEEVFDIGVKLQHVGELIESMVAQWIKMAKGFSLGFDAEDYRKKVHESFVEDCKGFMTSKTDNLTVWKETLPEVCDITTYQSDPDSLSFATKVAKTMVTNSLNSKPSQRSHMDHLILTGSVVSLCFEILEQSKNLEELLKKRDVPFNRTVWLQRVTAEISNNFLNATEHEWLQKWIKTCRETIAESSDQFKKIIMKSSEYPTATNTLLIDHRGVLENIINNTDSALDGFYQIQQIMSAIEKLSKARHLKYEGKFQYISEANVLTTSVDRKVNIYSLEKLILQKASDKFHFARSISTLTYSPDGHILALGDEDSNIVLHDTSANKNVHSLKGYWIASIIGLFIDKNSQTLISIDNCSNLMEWDITIGKLKRENKLYRAKSELINYSVICNDNQNVLVSDSISIRKVDIQSGKLITEYEKGNALVSYCPKANLIALGFSHGQVQILDANNFVLIYTINAHSNIIKTLSFSPCGKSLVSGDKKNYKLWNISNGQLLRTIEHLDDEDGLWIDSIYHPNGKYVLLKINHSTAEVLQLDTLEEFKMHLPRSKDATSSNDEKSINENLKKLFFSFLKISWLTQDWHINSTSNNEDKLSNAQTSTGGRIKFGDDIAEIDATSKISFPAKVKAKNNDDNRIATSNQPLISNFAPVKKNKQPFESNYVAADASDALRISKKEISNDLQKNIDSVFSEFIHSVSTQASKSDIFVANKMVAKKLTNAIDSFAPKVLPSEVLILIDCTVFGSAKEGLLLTRNALYGKDLLQSPKMIKLKDIVTFEFVEKTMFSKYFLVNGEPFIAVTINSDASRIFAKIFTDLLNNLYKKLN